MTYSGSIYIIKQEKYNQVEQVKINSLTIPEFIRVLEVCVEQDTPIFNVGVTLDEKA